MRATLYTLPGCFICWFLFLFGSYYYHALGDMASWIPFVAALITLILSVRIQRAVARYWEGASLLHQMQGEWFESASCLFAFSRKALKTKEKETLIFRQTLIRLLSMMSASALEEIHPNPDAEYDVIDREGLDGDTLFYLQEAKDGMGFNREQVLLHMTQVLITEAFESGVLDIPAPILSRVYQTLSRGYVHFINARKISWTPFPFPMAQAITTFLAAFSFLLPVCLTAVYDGSLAVPFLLTFISMLFLFTLNFAAVELEIPFGDRDNHLPLHTFQGDMNRSLLMLINENSDAVATVCEHVTTAEGANALMEKTDIFAHRMTVRALHRHENAMQATFSNYFGLSPVPELDEREVPSPSSSREVARVTLSLPQPRPAITHTLPLDMQDMQENRQDANSVARSESLPARGSFAGSYRGSTLRTPPRVISHPEGRFARGSTQRSSKITEMAVLQAPATPANFTFGPEVHASATGATGATGATATTDQSAASSRASSATRPLWERPRSHPVAASFVSEMWQGRAGGSKVSLMSGVTARTGNTLLMI